MEFDDEKCFLHEHWACKEWRANCKPKFQWILISFNLFIFEMNQEWLATKKKNRDKFNAFQNLNCFKSCCAQSLQSIYVFCAEWWARYIIPKYCNLIRYPILVYLYVAFCIRVLIKYLFWKCSMRGILFLLKTNLLANLIKPRNPTKQQNVLMESSGFRFHFILTILSNKWQSPDPFMFINYL